MNLITRNISNDYSQVTLNFSTMKSAKKLLKNILGFIFDLHFLQSLMFFNLATRHTISRQSIHQWLTLSGPLVLV